MGTHKILSLKEEDPLVVAARDAEQQLLNAYGITATTHFIPLPGRGIRLRILEIGTGKPVLLVPGNTGDVFPLIPLLPQLKGRRIIAINRPGGGLSEGMDHRTVDIRPFTVETITAVLDAFGLPTAPIVAHSMGGHWSLWAAMDRPQRVSALALLGVPGNVLGTNPPLALRLMAVPVLNRLLFNLITPRDTSQSLRGLSFMGHSPHTVAGLPKAMADCYYHFQKLPHYRISALSLMECGAPRITAGQLKSIKQRVMLYWGTNDPFGSVETGRQISATLPSCAFHAVEGAGHLPWLDNPAACGKMVLDFLPGY
jgi:pimeloyl-ACP methyl ester carboxylesterase